MRHIFDDLIAAFVAKQELGLGGSYGRNTYGVLLTEKKTLSQAWAEYDTIPSQ